MPAMAREVVDATGDKPLHDWDMTIRRESCSDRSREDEDYCCSLLEAIRAGALEALSSTPIPTPAALERPACWSVSQRDSPKILIAESVAISRATTCPPSWPATSATGMSRLQSARKSRTRTSMGARKRKSSVRPSLPTDFWRIPSDKLSGSPASNFCARR